MPAKAKTFTEADFELCQADTLTADELDRITILAHENFTPAKVQMGHVYGGLTEYNGILGKSSDAAQGWYRAAAFEGDPNGMYYLALEMEHDAEVTLEVFTECLMWYELASNRFGHNPARFRLFMLCIKHPNHAETHHIPRGYLHQQLALAAETIHEAMVVHGTFLINLAAEEGYTNAIYLDKALGRAAKRIKKKQSESK